MREIIIHTFQCPIKHIIKNLDKIKEQSFTAIQLSPIQPIKSGNEWWCYYQPLGFSIGNKSGSKEDLINLCSEAKKLGIKVIVDVVLRHTATDDGRLVPGKDVDKTLTDNPYFWTNAENTYDYYNRFEVIHKAFGLPMLDYNNEQLQNIYIKFLEELKSCGVSGFRVDMGKHFGLPEENSNFWPRVFGRFSDMFNYAECLECSTEILDKYDEFVNVLTDDKNSSDKSKMVIFIMSHDTELTFGYTLHMTDEIIIREWEHLLRDYRESHVLFYCRSYSNLWQSDEIRKINLELR